ncbi:MAG: phosphoribosylformylglycinamidine synthase [Cyclobacteriaceae bacterium]
MVSFFRSAPNTVYAVGLNSLLQNPDIQKLTWLLGEAEPLAETTLPGLFVGPRKEMVTPWSTNAVEITQTMGIAGITRIEEFKVAESSNLRYDRMLQVLYNGLDQEIFSINHLPEPIKEVENIAEYNQREGLALSPEEVEYLENVSRELGRKLTDSEVFGFSQVNSEHCRHKIFNGTFIIDGKKQEKTLFQLIKKTSESNPNFLISAYKDNVAFIKGPRIEQFAPIRQDVADFFEVKEIDSVISLKAETHNFPTTVEPFNGAATGSGGEIRDRLAGGKGSLPLAGTAVYMTAYPRLGNGRLWETTFAERKWLYQTPEEILIKASDGASDFGNKFGQPLINGSVLTFEHIEGSAKFGFDKVIMLAGGIGFGKEKDSKKDPLKPGDKIILLGGDNYRIGMGGGAVSSVATGEFGNAIELNAIQRSNPEMQKRVMNAIRALAESDNNPIISIHDHGAGGHFNCLSELLEETGGTIYIDKLPVGDPTLSDKEIISNESQERMGLAIHERNLELLKKIADRERAPMYVIGHATGDSQLQFFRQGASQKPIDFAVSHLLGSSPKTVLTDERQPASFNEIRYDVKKITDYLHQVLQLEAVACKDWLTNKVDRSVTGKVATQQTCGPVQLPLNNLGVVALDFTGKKGVATAIGHAPAAALINPAAGSRLAITEALTNIIWAPLTHGIKGISLSANWMWPAKQPGENARLYEAVSAVSTMAIALGINIPTGKDSLSMTQKYPDGETILSPGTVIISAVGEVSDICKTITPALQPLENSSLIFIDLSGMERALGGSALAQALNQLGTQPPDVIDAGYVVKCFSSVQELINQQAILAGHDISSGGLITTLLEMCFSVPDVGITLDFSSLRDDLVKILFSENPGLVIQVKDKEWTGNYLNKKGIGYAIIGKTTLKRTLHISHQASSFQFDIDELRDVWYKTSYILDRRQRSEDHAGKRFHNYKHQPLQYHFPEKFDGQLQSFRISDKRRTPSGIKAAIIREKGVNGDREMAYALYLAGFDVKDIHMTDLVSGREDLTDVNLIVFVGGFSNSDVLGSAKGWAGSFLFNAKAKQALDHFYKRSDTLSLGVCNGCQLMMELGLVYPEMENRHPKMHVNGSGKFESAFINITIPTTNSVMLGSLGGCRLGVWVAHGEGQFRLPPDESAVTAAAFYSYAEYPGNPNDSDRAVAALCSKDGRHLAIMPHLERSLFPWNWPYYPANRKSDRVSPWIEAFVNARNWVNQATLNTR